MKSLFAVGLNSKADLKMSPEEEKELKKQGFLERLPPKKNSFFKPGDIKNIIQVEKTDA